MQISGVHFPVRFSDGRIPRPWRHFPLDDRFVLVYNGRAMNLFALTQAAYREWTDGVWGWGDLAVAAPILVGVADAVVRLVAYAQGG